MTEEQRLDLKSQLPSAFVVQDAKDYPHMGFAKVWGMIGKFTVLLEWQYNETPNEILIEANGIDGGQPQVGICPYNKLKTVLAGLG